MRLRFAPSPTGGFHPGNARVAIFNFLFAKKYGAKYILRIEDTDLERSSIEYEKAIIEDLIWLGITWDEGPFRQSERLNIYNEYKNKLKEFTYKCFCTEEDLKAEREEQIKNHLAPKYSRKCINAKDTGKPFTIRFDVEKFIKFYKSNFLSFDDEIKGNLSYEIEGVSDFILFKEDGIPTYNMAVVADDIDMKITHVFRGEDHISNTFRQIMLFKALDKEIPKYGHLPILLSKERTKLSKRNGGVPIGEYRKEGYLPTSVFNHLALIGGSINGSIDESSDLEELVRNFDYKKTAVSACVYDIEKLKSINTKVIEKTKEEEIFKILNIEYKKYYTYSDILKIIKLAKEGTRTLLEIKDNLEIFINNSYEEFCFTKPEIDLFNIIYKHFLDLEKIDWLNLKNLILENTDLKGGKLFKFLRTIFTGRKNGPPLDEIMSLVSIKIIKERLSLIKKNV